MTTSLSDRFTVRPFALLTVGSFVSLTVGLLSVFQELRSGLSATAVFQQSGLSATAV